jgi:hypothetical protein
MTKCCRRIHYPNLGEADSGGSGGLAPQKTATMGSGILLFPEKEAKSVCSASQKGYGIALIDLKGDFGWKIC